MCPQGHFFCLIDRCAMLNLPSAATTHLFDPLRPFKYSIISMGLINRCIHQSDIFHTPMSYYKFCGRDEDTKARANAILVYVVLFIIQGSFMEFVQI